MGWKLRRIMKIKKSEDREIALKEYAKELGVSLKEISTDRKFLESVLVSRIINTERSYREQRLWIVALVACVTSVLSALTAWFAVSRCINP